jgi:hypothetical protein
MAGRQALSFYSFYSGLNQQCIVRTNGLRLGGQITWQSEDLAER